MVVHLLSAATSIICVVLVAHPNVNAHPVPKPLQLRNSVEPTISSCRCVVAALPTGGRIVQSAFSLPLLRTARHKQTEIAAAMIDTEDLTPSLRSSTTS
jgi:hypothetical protein